MTDMALLAVCESGDTVSLRWVLSLNSQILMKKAAWTVKVVRHSGCSKSKYMAAKAWVTGNNEMVDTFFVHLQKAALPKLRMPVVRPKLNMMATGPRSTAATAFRA